MTRWLFKLAKDTSLNQQNFIIIIQIICAIQFAENDENLLKEMVYLGSGSSTCTSKAKTLTFDGTHESWYVTFVESGYSNLTTIPVVVRIYTKSGILKLKNCSLYHKNLL